MGKRGDRKARERRGLARQRQRREASSNGQPGPESFGIKMLRHLVAAAQVIAFALTKGQTRTSAVAALCRVAMESSAKTICRGAGQGSKPLLTCTSEYY